MRIVANPQAPVAEQPSIEQDDAQERKTAEFRNLVDLSGP